MTEPEKDGERPRIPNPFRNWQPFKGNCERCRAFMDVMLSPGYEGPVLCEDCRTPANPGRTDAWAKFCPALFRETDINLLPTAPECVQAVLGADLSRRGLVLVGTKGTGKTRLAWMLLRREFMAGRKVAAVTATEFALAIRQHGGKHTLPEYLRGLCEARVLLLDDLGKEKLTDSVIPQLFHVFDQRMIHLRPTIVTTNYRSSAFVERFDEHGEPLLRRIRESCEAIVITPVQDSSISPVAKPEPGSAVMTLGRRSVGTSGQVAPNSGA